MATGGLGGEAPLSAAIRQIDRVYDGLTMFNQNFRTRRPHLAALVTTVISNCYSDAAAMGMTNEHLLLIISFSPLFLYKTVTK